MIHYSSGSQIFFDNDILIKIYKNNNKFKTTIEFLKI